MNSHPHPTGAPLRVAALFPNYAHALGISHTALSVTGHLRGPGVEVRLVQTASDPVARHPYTRDAVPRVLKRLVYRFWSVPKVNRYTERVFLRSLRPGEIAYLFPGTSLETFQKVKERGHTLLTERINCHTATAKRILDDAYARLDRPPTHGVTDEMARKETEELALADFVFAPSPLVAQSLADNGVPEGKILPASYGWDPDRLHGVDPTLPPADGLTVLSVGTLCVRKGSHLLLEAWAHAGVRGRLVFAGVPDNDVRTLCPDLLSREDVVQLGFVNPVEGVFRSADVFALPTLEEGSPLVSYEALACGLPLLVSPMGAGSVVRPEQEGLVFDPYDRDAWVAGLRRLAEDGDLRARLSASARERAQEFTWEQAGRRRREELLRVLGKGTG